MLLIIATALCILSCSEKDSGSDIVAEGGKYFVGDAEYASLDAAIKAYTQNTTAGCIKLGSDCSETSVKIPDEYPSFISIDLNGHTLTFTKGGIDLNKASLNLQGASGTIKTLSQTEALLSSDQTEDYDNVIVLDGGISVMATNAIKSSTNVYLDSEFNGTLNGNVDVYGGCVVVESGNCKVNIPTLSLHGECEHGVKSMLNCVSETTDNRSISIGNINCDHENPVSAETTSGISVTGGNMHIHVYKTEEMSSPTCLLPRKVSYVCSECGFTKTVYEGAALDACDASKLQHVAAKAQTLTESGNVEHWYCSECGRCYADADGKNSILSAHLSADQYISGEDYFLKIKDVVNEKYDGAESKVMSSRAGGSIFSAFTGALGICSFCMSLVANILNWTSSTMFKYWQELNQRMDHIDIELQKIDNELKTVMNKVDAVTPATDYNNRINNLASLNAKMKGLLNTLKPIVEDSKLTDDEKTAQIVQTLKTWASTTDVKAFKELTEQMLESYCTQRPPYNSYPESLEGYMKVCKWEHDGYPIREAIVDNEHSVLINAAIIVAICIKQNIIDYTGSESLRTNDLQALVDDVDAFQKTTKTEAQRINRRDSLYRNNQEYHVCLSRKMQEIDFFTLLNDKEFKTKGFPRYNDDGVAVKNCDKMLTETGLSGDFLNVAMAREAYQQYAGKKDVKPSLYTVLSDSLGFYNIPDDDNVLIFTQNTDAGNDTFKHDDDTHLAEYKIFSWQIDRGCTHGDHFGIRTALYDKYEISTGREDVITKCAISSYSDGRIKEELKDSNKTKWRWFTAVPVTAE